MPQRLRIQFIASALAIFVSGFCVSSNALPTRATKSKAAGEAPTELPSAQSTGSAKVQAKPADRFASITYQDLRPRLLLRAANLVVSTVNRDPTYLNVKMDGYTPELAYTEKLLSYAPTQLFRVLYVSRGDDFQYTGTDMSDTGYNLIQVTLQPVDAELRAVGETFELATKAKAEETVKEFVGDTQERVSRLGSLTFSRAQVRDVLLNAFDIETPQGLIPANSKSQIVSIQKERRSWTFTYNYHLTVRVSPCPDSLRDNNCQAQIENVSYLPDTRFGHWVHPSNVRSWKIWGITIVY